MEETVTAKVLHWVENEYYRILATVEGPGAGDLVALAAYNIAERIRANSQWPEIAKALVAEVGLYQGLWERMINTYGDYILEYLFSASYDSAAYDVEVEESV
jgi:hypothetical protein